MDMAIVPALLLRAGFGFVIASVPDLCILFNFNCHVMNSALSYSTVDFGLIGHDNFVCNCWN